MPSFNWKDYIEFADNLYEQDKSQNGYRNSISRSYFGILNLTKIFLNISTKGTDGHQRVIDKLQNSDATKEEFTLGKNIDTMRNSRNQADYIGTIDFKDPAVKTHLQLVKTSINTLDKLRNESI